MPAEEDSSYLPPSTFDLPPPPPEKPSTLSPRTLRWALAVAICVVVAAALALLFLLSIATNNRALYERHYGWLLWVNIGVTAMLGLVIAYAVMRLAVRMRHGKFGSKLLLKLAGIFAFVGFLPGVLIYGVSYQFVSRSIESWFDVRVEGALEAGLNLGRTTLQIITTDLATRTRIAAERAAETPERQQLLALERLREQLDAHSISILGASGQPLVTTSASRDSSLLPERPSATMLRQARSTRVVAQIEGLDDEPRDGPPRARVHALAWISTGAISLGQDNRYLQVTQLIAPELAANALAVQAAYSEYQQRALGREGLRKMYIGTLTLTLILAVFSAVLMAAVLGHQIGRPLVLLAEGVRQVARGDLRPTRIFASRDELGGLTRAFAEMIRQLADARTLAQQSLADAESAKAHLQTILDNLSAGVIVFDAHGSIDIVNPGATRILQLPLQRWHGRPLNGIDALTDFAQGVDTQFEAHRIHAGHAGETDPGESWQHSFEIRTGPQQAERTLLVRGAALPAGTRLIVFDDISDVVSAQRSVAWAEVARRLAHEIKNPLTPIQLSAERLQHKLEAKLAGTDQQMLVRSVATIVNQVQAMKQLVNEFRDYARLPSAQLVPLDLNELVGEVLTLYATAQETNRLCSHLDKALPMILGDASQLRQVIHNLVQNGLDAVDERPDGQVHVQTEMLHHDDGSMRAVRLKITDNGPGFNDKVLKRAFEPYVTTKARGTGLGLAVVKKIADEHGARVRAHNLQDASAPNTGESARTGAQVSISFSRWVTKLDH